MAKWPSGGEAQGEGLDPRNPGLREEELPLEESIEVAGVPLVVWAARLSLFLLIQGAIVLASYVIYGFGTDPRSFALGFRVDPLHAAINCLWGAAGTLIGFFMPRLSIQFALAFAAFFTLFAGLGTFLAEPFGMRLGFWENLVNWLLALFGWVVAIYALSQLCLHTDPDG